MCIISGSRCASPSWLISTSSVYKCPFFYVNVIYGHTIYIPIHWNLLLFHFPRLFLPHYSTEPFFSNFFLSKLKAIFKPIFSNLFTAFEKIYGVVIIKCRIHYKIFDLSRWWLTDIRRNRKKYKQLWTIWQYQDGAAI